MHPLQLEKEITEILDELSAVQTELLALLDEKRHLMATTDMQEIESIQPREQQLLARLEACHLRRGELLAATEAEGLPGKSLRELTSNLPASSAGPLEKQVGQAAANMRLLQHQSLTNWVLAQRTLLHISQMLEIIATGGRLKPTYGEGSSPHSSGSLVDRAA